MYTARKYLLQRYQHLWATWPHRKGEAPPAVVPHIRTGPTRGDSPATACGVCCLLSGHASKESH